MGGGTRGVCVCLGSLQQPELQCLPWGHRVTPRDITAVQDIVTLWGIVTLRVTVTLWNIVTPRDSHRMEHSHPVGHCHPVGHHHPVGHCHSTRHQHPVGHRYTLQHCHPSRQALSPQGIVTVCQPLCSLPALRSSHVLCLPRDTMALCGSACLGTGTPSASSACLGTWASPGSSGTRSLSPTQGQDP